MPLDRRHFLAALSAAALAGPMAARAAGPTPAADRAPPSRPASGEALDIAMLLYPGFTALDFVGPYHFLGTLIPGVRLHVVTNRPDLSPVASDQELRIVPTTTLADCPRDLAVLFVPGGTMGTVAAASDPATVDFVRDRGARARYVTSVCTGSLLLGVAGLLEGRRATSHWSVVDVLARFGAIPTRERVVRDGNVVTGAGVSAGLDFGVTLVEELGGRKAAEAAVLVSEYAPAPPIDGGTLETARPEIARMLEEALAPFTEKARDLS